MKKIMFNDKYGLTQAVLEGRKTQTRRIISVDLYNRVDWKYFEEGHNDCIIDEDISILDCGRYFIGEEVAIAQKYSDIEDMPFDREFDVERGGKPIAGWDNKMFVEAMYMPHHIRITNVRVERLQDISDEDCIAEGIRTAGGTQNLFKFNGSVLCYLTPKEAYARLIDKVGKKGTWKSNPYVFVYEFKLID